MAEEAGKADPVFGVDAGQSDIRLAGVAAFGSVREGERHIGKREGRAEAFVQVAAAVGRGIEDRVGGFLRGSPVEHGLPIACSGFQIRRRGEGNVDHLDRGLHPVAVFDRGRGAGVDDGPARREPQLEIVGQRSIEALHDRMPGGVDRQFDPVGADLVDPALRRGDHAPVAETNLRALGSFAQFHGDAAPGVHVRHGADIVTEDVLPFDADQFEVAMEQEGEGGGRFAGESHREIGVQRTGVQIELDPPAVVQVRAGDRRIRGRLSRAPASGQKDETQTQQHQAAQ